ncbi:MAG: DUF2235 domain-containing protein [Chlorobi bacterium]|nr:DUF2235 domain-containing protein [Chlorobiota bacterium]
MKRIVICADGTWNKPEKDLQKDFPTNVLKVARAIAPVANDGIKQVVFYDWGLGSYHASIAGGGFGKGINKNIADNYRFIVQNYDPGDELYFFGFSRGAYTVRSLAGFINNCSILKREHANRIEEAFEVYKSPEIHPDDDYSVNYRKKYAVALKIRIKFIGVWDTVGALGIPFRMFGFLNEKHLFHDNKIGPNIDVARHAMAIDELRDDFKPTIWKKRTGMDLQQVWFAGVHSDVGGGYKPDNNGELLADIPLKWMLDEAAKPGLELEKHIYTNLKGNPLAQQHDEYEGFFKVLGKYERRIYNYTPIHASVKKRFENKPDYRPKMLLKFINKYGWANIVG